MRLDLGHIASYLHADVQVPPADAGLEAVGVTWDSREVAPGFVYFALPGERVDGHDFAEAALEGGACAVVASRPLSEAALEAARVRGAAVFTVSSTADAFTELARGWRGHLKATVVGLTGSVGKTTTKNLIRDVLASRFSTVATKANQNNELGVPNTVLAADPETEMLVVEMGMRGAGQIAGLCDFVRPDWGVVTNVGESHIELLGSRENIAAAKAELVAALPAGGRAFLNDADDFADFVWDASRGAERGVSRVRFDGSGAEPTPPCVWAEEAALDEQGRARFVLCARGFDDASDQAERVPCALSLRGLHSVHNALAAAAVGRAAGIPLDGVAAALAASAPESGRQEVLAAEGGYTVVNDAYNASPDSMRASLSLLRAMQVAGRRVAVLGDMGELGSFAPQAHREVGRAAADAGLDCLVCAGDLSRLIAEGAREAGMPGTRVHEAASREEALTFLQDYLAPGDAVLVKASHSMELDRIAKGLLN